MKVSDETEQTRTVKLMASDLTEVRTANISLCEEIKKLEALLSSARCIAQRKGVDTAWTRFDNSIRQMGISAITARTYKILEVDREIQRSASVNEREECEICAAQEGLYR
jgi:hypothetical protein